LEKTGTKEKLEQIKPELNDPSVKEFTGHLMEKGNHEGAKIYDNLNLGGILGNILHEQKLKQMDQKDFERMERIKKGALKDKEIIEESLNLGGKKES